MKLIELAKKISEECPLSLETSNTIQQLNNPLHSIAVVGKFQVGKTKFLNEVFLGNKILLEGIGICKTAVPTEIRYGNTPKMTVYYRDVETMKPLPPGQEVTVSSPEVNDLEKATTASDDEARLVLSQKTERVLVEQNCDYLKGYSLIDTPGIDDPNQELLANTTYHVLPTVDMAIVVVSPTMLDQTILKMLQKEVFGLGISHFIVLISYDPSAFMANETLVQMKETIASQLRGAGLTDIPVEIICYDKTVDGNILKGSDEIRNYVINFIKDRCEKSRIDKVLSLLRKDLESQILTIELELRLLSSHGNEIQQAKEQLEREKKRLELIFESIQNDYRMSLQQNASLASSNFRNACYQSLNNFIAGFTGKGLQEAKDQVAETSSILYPEIEAHILEEISKTREFSESKLRGYSTQLEKDITDALTGLPESISFNLYVEGGIISKIPTIVIKAIDYGIFALSLEGILPALVLRYILGIVPVIKNWLPTAFVEGIIKRSVKNELESQMPNIITSFEELLHNYSTNSLSALDDILKNIFTSCIQPFINAVNAAENHENERSSRIAHLREKVNILKAFDEDIADITK